MFQFNRFYLWKLLNVLSSVSANGIIKKKLVVLPVLQKDLLARTKNIWYTMCVGFNPRLIKPVKFFALVAQW